MPFASLAQEHWMLANHPEIAHRWMMEARQKGVPVVQPGGVQPYHGSSPQQPGAALNAMQRGTRLDGSHPADAMRAVQRSARRPQSLLHSLGY